MRQKKPTKISDASERRPRRSPTSAAAAKASEFDAVEEELRAMVAPIFAGIDVHVARSPRWNRPAATFTWSGFKDLLPEERFHRLMSVIPEEFRSERMSGFIWLELAPGETIDALLKMPRSDDITSLEREFIDRLTASGFFDALRSALGDSPHKRCANDFQHTVGVLTKLKFNASEIRDAKLLFIRHHAFCDCAILECGLERPIDGDAGASKPAKQGTENNRSKIRRGKR